MAATGTPTPNIGLRRAQGTDPASVDDINYNSALIDTKLGAVGNSSVQDQIDTLNSKITTINSNIQAKQLTTATDFNTLTRNNNNNISLYVGDSISIHSNIPISISNTPFSMEVIPVGASGYSKQIVHYYGQNARTFFRTQYYNNGTVWGAWKEVTLTNV